MNFSLREAAAALLICTITFTAAGKPGLALTLDKPKLVESNSPTDASVPTPAVIAAEIPPLAPRPADAPDADQAENDDAPARYASLAAAVDAQSMPEAPDDELRCLAGAIYFEAKGEPLSGQLAVANVIINRTKSGRFPRGICSVVKQRGQFSFLRGGEMPEIPHNGHYRTAMAVAQVALDGGWESPVGDALFFHASRVAPSWGKRRVAAIGGHVFYR